MNIGTNTHDQFVDKATAFHGYPAPGLIIGGYMVELATRHLSEGVLYKALSETANCLPDAVQLLTPCTVGNGYLQVLPFGIYALTLYDKHTGAGVRVRVNMEKLAAYPEIQGWFVNERHTKYENTPRLHAEIKAAGASILSWEQVQIRKDRLEHCSFGALTQCPLCGELHPAAFGGLCRSCQGQSPYDKVPGSVTLTQPHLQAVPVEDAVGQHALHDMTRILPGEEKGAAFTAGQQLSAGDVCRLQHMGRNRVYVQESTENLVDWVHEDAVAKAFGELMPGAGVRVESAPHEGKVNFVSTHKGLLVVDVPRLERFNLVPDVMCATRHAYSVVHSGSRVAGSRAIPLYLSRPGFLKALTALEGGPLFHIAPLRVAQIGILVTGTEVFQGLIQDRFAPIITQKANQFDCTVVKTIIAPDETQRITDGVRELLAAGADLIITTAGLSVDPDDVTREGLVRAGLTDVLYGMPVLPGTMTLTGRIGHAQVIGVPACALFFKTTGFDLMFPRLLARLPISRLDLARLGNGGLCMECKTCTFPKCPFGKS